MPQEFGSKPIWGTMENRLRSDREVIKDLTEALKFYSDRMSFTHMDGKCSPICKEERDVARDATSKVKHD